MNALLMESHRFVKGLDPVADAFSGTVYSDIVDMGEFRRILFQIYAGVGATGTSTLTVEACDDTSGSNVVAIPFYSREITTGDTEGAITAQAATGFTTTAGSSKLVLVEVREDALAATGYRYVRLKAVESVDSPVLGCICICGESKVQAASKPSAID